MYYFLDYRHTNVQREDDEEDRVPYCRRPQDSQGDRSGRGVQPGARAVLQGGRREEVCGLRDQGLLRVRR